VAHSGEHRSARFAAWGERLWRHPLRYGIPALVLLVALAFPVTQLKTSMPSIKVVPSSDSSRIGYGEAQAAMGLVPPAHYSSSLQPGRLPRSRGLRRAIPVSPR